MKKRLDVWILLVGLALSEAAPALASGTDFAAVRKRTELDLVSACPGLAGMDVSEAAFIVMGMATKDMDDDLGGSGGVGPQEGADLE